MLIGETHPKKTNQKQGDEDIGQHAQRDNDFGLHDGKELYRRQEVARWKKPFPPIPGHNIGLNPAYDN